VLLAASEMAETIMDHVTDHPWPYDWARVEVFGTTVTLVSSSIISMLLTGVILVAVLVPMARRHRYVPSGSANVLEVLVVFVRDMIARPALHDKADEHMPFLLTLFMYVLGLNLLGIVPLEAIAHAARLPLIGHTATSIPTVCAGLASLALLKIVVSGLDIQARHLRKAKHWSTIACYLASPIAWIRSLSPSVPGMAGKVLALPLALMELMGAAAKCFALMVRLFANMLSGHALLAILMMFVLMTIRSFVETRATHLFYVGPLVVLGSVAVDVLELLVAGLQAYIFTFLTAMFLGLYAEGH